MPDSHASCTGLRGGVSGPDPGYVWQALVVDEGVIRGRSFCGWPCLPNPWILPDDPVGRSQGRKNTSQTRDSPNADYTVQTPKSWAPSSCDLSRCAPLLAETQKEVTEKTNMAAFSRPAHLSLELAHKWPFPASSRHPHREPGTQTRLVGCQ